MFIAHSLATTIAKAERHFPAVIVTGPRQVGKSSLLRAMHPEAAYVTLDDPDERVLAADDPKLFVQRHPAPLIVDEVQYAPALFSVLKMVVDEEKRPGRYWLTGSQRFQLMKNVSDSMAGRLAVFELGGLTGREIAGDPLRGSFRPPGWRLETPALREPELFARIWRGGFPELVTNPDLDAGRFFASYVATYLQRDVHELASVGNSSDFLAFLRIIAGRTGQLLKLDSLSNDTNVPYKRLKQWLSVLEASGLIYYLHPYYGNETSRLTKTAKLYFADTGLAAWLGGWPTPETLMRGAAAGPMLETYVVGQIRSSYLNRGLVPPVWLYRTLDGKEVDVVVVEAGVVYPIDVKRGVSIDRRIARGLDISGTLKLEQGPGLVICPTERPYPLSEAVDTYPAGWL